MSNDPPRTDRIPTTHLYAIIGLIVGFVGGFGLATYLAQSGPPRPTSAAEIPPPIADELAIDGRPTSGPPDAPITIVEFTDYQCPFCRRYFEQTYAELRGRYGEQLRYVVRNLPLTSIHPNAQKAAEAAECAHDQGRFWDYHDLLFQRSRELGTDSLKRYAAELGLSQPVFDQCLDSGSKETLVNSDVREAFLNGARGTPSFFINGYLLAGAQPIEVFEEVIRSLTGVTPQ